VLTYADGVFGLKGWQWFFVLEGAPAILRGLVVLAFLTDRPEEAHCLSAAQRQKLLETLEREDAARRGEDDEAIWTPVAPKRAKPRMQGTNQNVCRYAGWKLLEESMHKYILATAVVAALFGRPT
jgi:hypothetical protein